MGIFNKKYKLGLDIGSSMIKVCLPHRGGKSIVLRIPTPEGMVSKGVLQNIDQIEESMRPWVRKH
ncbi:MAG TPA: hypothetical protein DG577_08095, partial [Firmicutes bacterium]|nr:hypothetical protein [Bacillota bacterium]